MCKTVIRTSLVPQSKQVPVVFSIRAFWDEKQVFDEKFWGSWFLTFLNCEYLVINSESICGFGEFLLENTDTRVINLGGDLG